MGESIRFSLAIEGDLELHTSHPSGSNRLVLFGLWCAVREQTASR